MKLQTFLLTMIMVLGMMGTQAQADSTKKYQKIEELFKVLNMEEECIKAAKISADQTLASTPQFANKKEEAREFFIKYMGYANVKNDLIRIYSKHYTTDEIGELIQFYKTSAGKKFSTAIVSIGSETMAMYSDHLQQHSEELNKLVNSQVK